MSLNPKLLFLLAIGVVWGMTIPLTKIAVSSGHQPIGLIFWQLVFSGVALGIISLIRGIKVPVSHQSMIFYLVVGIIGTLLPNSFSYLAAAQLPAGVMAIAIASVPMFSLAIALMLQIESFSILRLAGVLLGGAAIVLLVGPEASLPDPEKAVFVLVALVAPFCYACEGSYIALRSPVGVDPLMTLLGASFLGAIIAAPLALMTESWVDISNPWHAPEWALFGSSMLHIIAYTSAIWLMRVAGPVFTSQIAYIVTIAGVFLSALFLGENYSGWVWAALGLMLAGLVMVRPRRAPKSGSKLNPVQP